ncbi:ATP-grasp domain-containing protein [Chishuiella sp.]|uniref:ATP-grasp domain-containing protein n=1 Tax=Chishuiella sp. TaxID=1969467 RepID=UPI0028ABEC8D|nr:ATP-grasp domain-containing protein [Chishuiella sp.]
MKYNILVFPCGSEIALEIHRSLKYSIHVDLFGANSVDDHGKFIYENYIGNLPFFNEENFIPKLIEIVKENKIDAIYPAMDSVITILKKNEEYLGCKIISSSYETTEICLSKLKTYRILSTIIPTPLVFDNDDKNINFPVFLKPEIGYGSRGAKKVTSQEDLKNHLSNYPTCIISEYLPGKEYTVDCFTDFKGKLLFVGSRERSRISNGISVNTSSMILEDRFLELAKKINDGLNFNGAWFFQVKERYSKELVLMEVASRFGGSSSVYRMKGINFAALSLFNIFNIPVSIIENNYEVEMDRALDIKFKSNLVFNHVYIDFDDVIIINDKVNIEIISFLYKMINEGKQIYLITKHKFDINKSLISHRLEHLFDEVIHLKPDDNKWKYIKYFDSIFIDDSFSERNEVKNNLQLPVFSPDMISLLI